MPEQQHIFLSYRSLERAFVQRLFADLTNAGVRVWLDQARDIGIQTGDRWTEAIGTALKGCVGLLIVITPEYFESRVCLDELDFAYRNKLPIFPVLLRETSESTMPFWLPAIQYTDFRNLILGDVEYLTRVTELVQRINREQGSVISTKPDAETQYLNGLIAELSPPEKGVRQYVELAAEADIPLQPSKALIDDEWGYAELKISQQNPRKPETLPLNSITEALEKYPCFVLVGDPGSGKTTTIRRLALANAEKRLAGDKNSPIPLLLYLPHWAAREQETTIEGFIRSNWTLPGDPISQIQSGEVFLYLDGLNEMGAKRHILARKLQDWITSTSPPKNLIITCRSDIELEIKLPTILTKPLDWNRIKEFSTNYLGPESVVDFLEQIFPSDIFLLIKSAQKHNISEDQTREFANYLLARSLFQLATNPYFLRALIEVYKDVPQRRLPSLESDLFHSLSKALWEREYKRSTPDWISFEEASRFLGDLAFHILYEDRPLNIPFHEACNFVNKKLLILSKNANVLIIKDGFVSFYHQLMLEYFAAVGLGKLGIRILLDRYGEDGHIPYRLQPVITNFCRMLANPDEIIDSILTIDLYLAAECICKSNSPSEKIVDKAIDKLTQQLDSDNDEVRWRAVLAIGDIGNSKSVSHLMGMLYDSSEIVRSCSSMALGKIGVPALPELIRFLREADEEIKNEVSFALIEIGEPAVPYLLEFLPDYKTGASGIAAFVLQVIGAVPSLCLALKHEHLFVRFSVAHILGEIRDPKAIPYLIAHAKDKDNWIRETVVEALGKIGDKSATLVLLTALKDRTGSVRWQAAKALGEIKDETATEGLIERLSDRVKPYLKKQRICEVAAEALENIGTSEALAALEEWRHNQQ